MTATVSSSMASLPKAPALHPLLPNDVRATLLVHVPIWAVQGAVYPLRCEIARFAVASDAEIQAKGVLLATIKLHIEGPRQNVQRMMPAFNAYCRANRFYWEREAPGKSLPMAEN